MNIIVHHSKDSDSLCTLEKRVAIVHAEAVLKYIERLSCPKEQKIEMINLIIRKDLHQ